MEPLQPQPVRNEGVAPIPGTPVQRPSHSFIVAYFLWATLGYLGAHRFYTGKYFTGILYACSFGFFFIGWALDLFLTYFLVQQARARVNLQRMEKPELFAEQPVEIAAWAKDQGMWGYLMFPTRLFFFTVVPPVFVVFTVMLRQYELGLIMLVILVATGLIGSFKKSIAHSELLERLPLMGEVLATVRRLHDYYRENKPGSFLFYLFYPLVGPFYLLFSQKARQEIKLYVKIIAGIALLLLIETAFSYMSTYPPHLGPGDAVTTVIISLFFMCFVAVAFLLPMATTAFSLHLSGRQTQLRVLTVWALLLSVPSGVGIYMQTQDSTSLWSWLLLGERFEKASFREELTESSHMFLLYHIQQAARGEVTEQPTVNNELTDKYRRHIGGIAVQDEVNSFSVLVFRHEESRWYGVRLYNNGKPRLLYLMNSQGGLYRSWQNVPPSVTQLFALRQQQNVGQELAPLKDHEIEKIGLLDEFKK